MKAYIDVPRFCKSLPSPALSVDRTRHGALLVRHATLAVHVQNMSPVALIGQRHGLGPGKTQPAVQSAGRFRRHAGRPDLPRRFHRPIRLSPTARPRRFLPGLRIFVAITALASTPQ